LIPSSLSMGGGRGINVPPLKYLNYLIFWQNHDRWNENGWGSGAKSIKQKTAYWEILLLHKRLHANSNRNIGSQNNILLSQLSMSKNAATKRTQGGDRQIFYQQFINYRRILLAFIGQPITLFLPRMKFREPVNTRKFFLFKRLV